jgi:hypothetical protein
MPGTTSQTPLAAGGRQLTGTGIDWAGLLRILLLIGLATLLAPPAMRHGGAVAAQESRSVEWSRFDVSLALQEDGSFAVTERQEVSFSGGPFRNGFRDIPLARIARIDQIQLGELIDGEVRPYEFVSSRAFSGQPNTYAYSERSTDLHVEWSFPPTTSASRVFVLQYVVDGALRVYLDQDPPYQQISWTAVGSGITEIAPVRNASMTIELLAAAPLDRTEVQPPDDPANHTTDGRVWRWETSDLGQGEEWTVGVRFPPQAAAAPPAWQAASDRAEALQAERQERQGVFNLLALAIAGLLVIGGPLALVAVWFTRGRDPRVPLVADFTATPPDDTPAGIVGALVDERANEHDIIASLADLGSRGVLTIEETEAETPGWFSDGNRDFVLTVRNEDAPLATFEKLLLGAFFGRTLKNGESVRLSQVKDKFNLALPSISTAMYQDLVDRGFFTASPDQTRARWRRAGVVGAVLALFGGCFAIGALSEFSTLVWLPVAILAALAGAVYFASSAMPRKTEQGAEATAKWNAFRRYLDEIERYEQLDRAKAIFERYLPYAVAFGLEKGWVQKFAAVDAPAPSWYGTPNLGPAGGPAPFGRGRGPVVILGDGGFGGGGGSGGGIFGSPGGGRGDGGPVSGWGGEGGGLQDFSDAMGGGLQGLSGGLFDLFDSASRTFSGGDDNGGGGFGGWSSGGGGGRSSFGGFGGGGGGFSGGGGRGSGGGGGGFS